MLTPNMGNRPNLRRTWWAADTGCFSQPETFSLDRYLAFLDRYRDAWSTCLFATAPDRWGDGRATLAAALPALDGVRRRVPVSLVYQRGLERLPIPWDGFDVLFLGGPDRYRFSPRVWALAEEALSRGKRVHVGRVNSARRLIAVTHAGAHSADGTYLAFGPDTNLPKLRSWLNLLDIQPPLVPPPVIASELRVEVSA
jgi:hypothetical protein